MTAEPNDFQARFRAEQQQRARDEAAGTIPVRHRDISLRREIQTWADRYVTGTAGNLILLGPTGTGKTTQAWQAWRHIWFTQIDNWDWGHREPGHSEFYRPPVAVSWFRAADLAAKLRPGDGPENTVEDTIDEARRAGLLVVDDLGSTPFTAWQLGQLERIVDHRWQHQLPIMATSNRPDLADMLGQRLASRLWQDATVITMTGQDHRQP